MARPESQCEDFIKFIKYSKLFCFYFPFVTFEMTRYLSELKSQVLQRLTTTVEDEAANRATLHELTEREQHYEESRNVLQAKLNELRTEKEQVSLGLDQTLRKLQAELADITQVGLNDHSMYFKHRNNYMSYCSTTRWRSTRCRRR